jgi:hypothetical protein
MSWASESGPLAPVPMKKAGNPGPVGLSKFFVLNAQAVNGNAQITLPLDTPSGAIALVLGEPAARAYTADHKALEPIDINDAELKRMNFPSANTRFNLDRLSPGLHTMKFEGLKTGEGLQMVIAQPESPLSLSVQVTPLAARSGDPVKITAEILDTELTISNVIKAQLPDGRFFRLNDNGTNGDEIADDGVYSYTFIAPGVENFRSINIRTTAKGKRSNGSHYLRNALTAVMVTTATARIDKDNITVENTGLSIPVASIEKNSGNYRILVLFGFNGTTLAYSSEDFSIQSVHQPIKLPLPTAAHPANQAVIKLLNKTTLGLEQEIEISLTPTAPPPDFQSLTPKSSPLPLSKVRAAQLIQNQNDNHHH